MRAGRTISEEDRERARLLIARVDQKIRDGLLSLAPAVTGGRWTGDRFGAGLGPTFDGPHREDA